MGLANVLTPVDGTWQDISSQITVDNTKITSYSNVKVLKRNGLVFVDLRGLKFANTGDAQTIVTGLPKSSAQSNALFSSTGSVTSYNQIGNCCWIDSGSTSIKAHIRVNTNNCWGTLIYPTEE